MQKKIYKAPTVEIYGISREDFITASGDNGGDGLGGIPDDWNRTQNEETPVY